MITKLLILSILMSGVAEAKHLSPDVEADRVRASRRAWAARGKHEFVDPDCKYVSYISGRPPAGTVALSFDDGPTKAQTPYILSVLKRHEVKATFFLLGAHAKAHPELVRMILADGHRVGNHSWDHPDFHRIKPEALTLEIGGTDRLLGSILGPRKMFRYPYGNSTCVGNEAAHALSYKIVGWHVDSCDWAFNRTGHVTPEDAKLCDVAPENVANFRGHVVASVAARKGGILLMHEIQPHTIRQLDAIVGALKAKDYRFVLADDGEFAGEMR